MCSANIIFGAVIDDTMPEGELRVTVIATGFHYEAEEEPLPRTRPLIERLRRPRVHRPDAGERSRGIEGARIPTRRRVADERSGDNAEMGG